MFDDDVPRATASRWPFADHAKSWILRPSLAKWVICRGAAPSSGCIQRSDCVWGSIYARAWLSGVQCHFDKRGSIRLDEQFSRLQIAIAGCLWSLMELNAAQCPSGETSTAPPFPPATRSAVISRTPPLPSMEDN